MPDDNGFPLWRALAGFGDHAFRAIRLGLGVLPTTAIQNISGILAIALVAIFVGNHPPYALGIIAVIVVYLIYSNERSFRYAEKHPIPALMGGGAILELLRDQAAKDGGIVVTGTRSVPGVIDHTKGGPDA